MLSLGLLGKDIQHSRSQEMYQKILKQEVDYHLFDYADVKKIPPLDSLMSNIAGLSITSPYKKVFLEIVTMSSEIAALSAINCIKKVGDEFRATNTDYLALKELIDQIVRKYKRQCKLSDEIIILGDGAMGKVLVKICQLKKIKHQVYSRKIGNLKNLADDLSLQSDPLLVINTCSREYIFEYDIPSSSIFWDLNYNMPAHESFFHKQNITYIDGLSLLELQARHAVTFWNLKFY